MEGVITRAVISAVLLLVACSATPDRVTLELSIAQDTELILQSYFGKPAQLAVWLEDLADGSRRTLFVTRCAGAGAWNGKSESPEALPRWYEVYREETGHPGYPSPAAPAPDGVTRPTPTEKLFRWTADLDPGRRSVLWIEVNISADFSERFPRFDEATGFIDTDFAGQPSLLYRAEITATPGTRFVPVLFGRTVPGTAGEVTRDLGGVTTARGILGSIEVWVR
jgi:hypothetical protein